VTALEREWERKLRESGFQDREGRDRDGPLSDRGNLHPVEETQEAYDRLGERAAEGQAFTSWADSVLHGRRFRSREQREAWRMHAEGMGERDIATALTTTRGAVRKLLDETRRAVSKGGKRQWQNPRRQRLEELETAMRQAPELLVPLIATMIRRSGLG
jgi:hypothetical protein